MNVLAAAFLSLMAQSAPEQIFSGPQPGEPVPPFKMLAMNGPSHGQEITVECKAKPTVILFIGKMERIAAQYIRLLDDYLAAHADSVDGFIVSLTADMSGEERHMPAVLQSLQMKALAGISPDGIEGYGGLGLNVKVMLTTLLVGKDGKVLFNQALLSPSGAVDFPKLQAEMDKLPSPSLDAMSKDELKAEILRLRKENADLRAKSKEAKPKGRGDSMKNDEMSGGSKEDEDAIRNMARPIIRPEADQKQIDDSIRKVGEFVGDNEARRKFWISLIEIILKQGYGSDAAKAALKADLVKYKK